MPAAGVAVGLAAADFRRVFVRATLGSARHFVRAAVIEVVRRHGRWQRGNRSPEHGHSVVASTALWVTGVSAPVGSNPGVGVRGSLSVDSYAATSSTGNSAVASLSTSVEDALVFTGGIAGIPKYSLSAGILAPDPTADG